MINYDKKVLERIKDWNKDNVYILTDFDRTLTAGDSESSWGVLSTSGVISPEYSEERTKLYQKYRPIELDESLDFETKNKLMIEWWEQHISLLIKYRLTEDVIKRTATNMDIMKFRDGAVDLLGNLYKKDIPVIIMSAGIGNFIEQFLLENNCYFSNIYIISNFIKFENGYAVGICEDIIHSLNKREDLLPEKIKKVLKDRKNVILLGDQLADIAMISEENRNKALKIGFCEENVEDNLKYFERDFDVVCTDKVSFRELNKEFKILS